MFRIILSFFGKSKILTNVLLRIGNILLFKQRQTVLHWKLINGDKTLRLNYPLHTKSIVFDIGGYLGDSTFDIYHKYKCNIYTFEPVREYYKALKKRFRLYKKIHVFDYGLAAKTEYVNLHMANDATSIYGQSSTLERVKFVNIKDVLQKYYIKKVDLVEINIEGGEYDLLEYLIKENLIKKFRDIQVQFHLSVKDAKARRNKIQKALRKTHTVTYQYPFVWENWSLKQ